MAWRPNCQLIAGELDNTSPGRVTGWLEFVGLDAKVRLDLRGDFHRDIRGAVLRLKNPEPMQDVAESRRYLEGFAKVQTGDVGDITAGLPPQDYVTYPYVEWYSDDNGRVALEFAQQNVEVVGTPLPWQTIEPVDRQKQDDLLVGFVQNLMTTIDRQVDARQAEERP